MDDAIKKINSVAQFIDNYFRLSQERGKMYGSIEEIESNWCLLNKIFFLLHGLENEEKKFSFQEFLFIKGFGAKRVSTVIKQESNVEPYSKLNQIWNEYLEWRNSKIGV